MDRTRGNLLRIASQAILALCLAVIPSALTAQNILPPNPSVTRDYPIVEFSGGVSYAHTDLRGPANMVGWHITFGMNPARQLRLLGDFGEQQVQSSTILLNGRQSTIKDYEYTFGPQIVYRRNPRFTPFAHGLFGVAARHYTVPSNTPGGPDVLAHDFGFASVLGGGMDVNVNRYIAIRAIQADVSLEHRNWIDAQFTPVIAQLPASGNWQARPRLACGIVIRVGSHASAH